MVYIRPGFMFCSGRYKYSISSLSCLNIVGLENKTHLILLTRLERSRTKKMVRRTLKTNANEGKKILVKFT
jgi:hypothetical protein